MAKLVIGKAAATFALPVEIQTPSGPAEVEFTAKHLTATEWAEMREANTETVNAEIKALFDKARAEAEAEYAASQKKTKKPAKGSADAAPSQDEADAAKEAAILELVKPVKNSTIKRLVAKHSAKMIQSIATGWDLDDEFTLSVLEQMCDKYQNAHEAIFAAYNDKLEGRRLGNSAS